MALNFLNNGYFAGKVGIGTESPQAQLTLLTTMASSPTTQIYLDVDGNNAVGGGCEIIFNTSATGGTLANYNAKITGTRSSANDGSSDLSFFTTLVASANSPAVRMTIKDNGNVGIGTTSPNHKLHVRDNTVTNGTGTLLELQSEPIANGGSLNLDFRVSSANTANRYVARISGVREGSGALSQLQFWTESSGLNQRMTILSGGNVGIGTTTPDSLLHVSADVTGANTGTITIEGRPTGFLGDNIATIDFHNSGNKRADIRMERGNTANDSQLVFSTSDVGTLNDALIINEVGNVGIGTTSPSFGTGGGLQITNATQANLRFTDTSASTFITDLALSNDDFYIINRAASGQLKFRVNANNEAMTIDSTGKVGIGTTSPLDLLHIVSTTADARVIIDSGDGFDAELKFFEDGVVKFTTGFDAATDSYVIGTANVDTGKRLVINSSGNLQLPVYTAGTLVSDASGNITVSSGGGAGGPYLPLAGGTMTGDINFNDGIEARFGDSQDLTIQSVGDQGYIQNYTGNLNIVQNADDSDIIFKSDNGSGGTATYFYLDGSLVLNRFLKDTLHNDDVVAKFGTGSDLRIQHSSGNNSSYIQNYTGHLIIENLADDQDIIFKSDDSSGGVTEYFRVDGGITKTVFVRDTKHLDTKKALFGDQDDLQISHDGFDSYINNFTGNLNIVNLANDKDIIFQSDNGSGGVTTYFRVDGGDERLQVDAPNGMLFPDNIIAKFGTSADLLIYHDGNNSRIVDNGTGELRLQGTNLRLWASNGENYLTAVEGGAVSLYYDAVKKLSTGSEGVGTATTAGGTLIDGWITTTQANAVNNTTIATTAYVNNKIALIPAGLVFQGTWNAATNTPTLTSGSGTTGNFYIVSVAGSTNLDGVTDWKVGDWAVFIEQGASDQWEKIDNSSVLDGIGTGEALPLWSGSGTSNTLTNSHITQSTSLANDIIIPQYIRHTGDTNTLFGFSQPDNFIINTNNASALTINSAQNATFTGNVDLGDSSNISMNNTAAGQLQVKGAGYTGAIALDATAMYVYHNSSLRDLVLGTNEVARLTIDGSSGNATFTGSITAPDFRGTSQFYLTSPDSWIFRSTGGSERMRVTSAGNVGIGTTSPTAKLQVAGTTTYNSDSAQALRVCDAADVSKGIHIGFDTVENAGIIQAGDFGVAYRSLSLNPNAGNVGIGTTSPNNKLDVNGDVFINSNYTANVAAQDLTIGKTTTGDHGLTIVTGNANTASIFFGDSNNNDAGMLKYQHSSNSMQFATNRSEKMRITSDGNVGIGDTGPSVKLQVSTDSPSNNVAALIGDGWVGNSNYHKEGGLLLISGTSQDATQTGAGIAFQTRNTQNTNYWKSSMIMDRDGAIRFTLGGAGTVAGSEDFTILSGGNVGIGETSPDSKLHIHQTGSGTLTTIITEDDARKLFIGRDAINCKDLNNNAALLYLNQAGGNVNIGNNLGIGTSSPQSKLQVAGGIQMADDTATASATKVGTMRYRTGTEYVEVTGVDLADGWTFTSGWNAFGGGTSITNSTTFVSQSGQGIYAGLGLTTSKTYKVVIAGTQPSGGYISIKAGTTGTLFGNISEQSFDKVLYATLTTVSGNTNSFYIRLADHASNTSIVITKLEIQEVTAEDASYADMCMQTGASTYEWVNIVRNTY